jgi:FixJ family two-component response regulator
MSEMDKFSLVPRAPGTLEKADAGPKRIISSMIADTLALAKPHRTRPPRIVMLDDEGTMLEFFASLVRALVKEATILTFTDAEKALRELMREAPDLFITDVYHPEPDGYELLRLLAEKKVKYPMIVLSGHAQEKDVQSCAGPNLNVTFLSKPFPAKAFNAAIEDALQISARRLP